MTVDKGIQIRNIYYMLTYAYQELRHNNYSEIQGEKFDEIFDLFAELLCRGIAYQLKQGLHREYIERHESLSTLRGKLDINGTLRNKMMRRQQLVCEFDEYSVNNIFNQIVKSTAFLLIRQKEVKEEKRQRLKKLMLFFHEVDVIPLRGIRWSAIRFDRNTYHYRLLLYICEFIVNDLLMTTESGEYKMKELSDERMEKLYEKFILSYYRKEHPELNPEAPQVEWNINVEKSTKEILPHMQTDTTLTRGDKKLIIDAKYYSKSMATNYDKNTIHSHNLYQISSYVFNEDKEHKGLVNGLLLYAKTQEEMLPEGQMVWEDGNIIYFKTLDLNQEFDNIKAQLEDIAMLI